MTITQKRTRVRELYENGFIESALMTATEIATLSDEQADRILSWFKDPEPEPAPAVPCDCGNPSAYWEGPLAGRREYACESCHGRAVAEPSIEERVAAAGEVLHRYAALARRAGDRQLDASLLADLLADLLHWCEEERVHFDTVLNVAKRVFDAEEEREDEEAE